MPPAHIVTAGFDPLRDEGEAYAERLREAGVEVTLKREPDLVHGFINAVGLSARAREAADCRLLRPFASSYADRRARVAQLVEHLHGKEGVRGSSPLPGFGGLSRGLIREP